MESKHTPGPWSLPHFAEPEVNCECGYVLTDGYMGAVATVHCSGERKTLDWSNGDNPPYDEAVANARLIAAAPDLIDGCNALIGLIQLVCGRDDMPPAIREALVTSHRLEEACAAVAKSQRLSTPHPRIGGDRRQR